MDTLTIWKTPAHLGKLFRPGTVAMIGASEEPGSVGAEVFRNLLAGNYQGTLYPVNPKYTGKITQYKRHARDTVVMPYVASAQELQDGVIDLALVMTPAATVPEITAQLGEKRVPAVVVISAGFNEAGPEGKKLSERLERILDEYDMTLVGPNCLGVSNMSENIRLNATFAQTPTRSGHGAFFSQSGAVGIDMIQRSTEANLGLSQFVSLGNSLDLQPAALLTAWEEDPEVRYVLGYLESGLLLAGMRDIAIRFTKTKPLLLLKAGQTPEGARAARSHTGALAGSEEAVEALVKQCGIQRFYSIESLMAAGIAFEHCPPMPGNRVAVLSNAGGYAVMTSDLMLSGIGKPYDLTLAKFSEATHQRLSELLPNTASRQNPIDTTATFPVEQPQAFRKVMETVVQDSAVDACMVEIIPLMNLKVTEITSMVSEFQQAYGKPIICVCASKMGKHLPSVALYTSLSDAVIGLGALNQYRRWREKASAKVQPPRLEIDSEQIQVFLDVASREGRNLLTTSESLSVLSACGIRVPEFRMAQTTEEALVQVRELGYPLAIKLNSKTVSHKTDVGGVQVDIRNDKELREAFSQMLQKLNEAGINRFETGEGILLQPYLPTGRELILGFRTDPHFGELIMIGRGGIYTQLDQDFQIRLNPLAMEDVQEMILQLKAYPILKGYRGKPEVDFKDLESTLLRLSSLARNFPEISELDINPYLARPQSSGSGCAIDARIILDGTR